MKRETRILAAALFGAWSCAVLLKIFTLGIAWKHEQTATHLLAAASHWQAGLTPCEQVSREVAWTAAYPSPWDGGDKRSARVSISSWPYPNSIIYDLPRAFEQRVEPLLMPRWTVFEVQVRCEHGKLDSVTLQEAQEFPGSEKYSPRPNGYSATTSLLSDWTEFEEFYQARGWQGHYSAWEMWEDGQLGQRRVGYQVVMDRYATADERRSGVDFNLDCFTRWRGCQDVDLMLRPLEVDRRNPFREGGR